MYREVRRKIDESELDLRSVEDCLRQTIVSSVKIVVLPFSVTLTYLGWLFFGWEAPDVRALPFNCRLTVHPECQCVLRWTPRVALGP